MIRVPSFPKLKTILQAVQPKKEAPLSTKAAPTSQSRFDATPARRREDSVKLGAVPERSEGTTVAAAAQAFTAMTQHPTVASALPKLGITDGPSLTGFLKRYSREIVDGTSRKDDVSLASVPADVLKEIVRQGQSQQLAEPVIAPALAASASPVSGTAEAGPSLAARASAPVALKQEAGTQVAADEAGSASTPAAQTDQALTDYQKAEQAREKGEADEVPPQAQAQLNQTAEDAKAKLDAAVTSELSTGATAADVTATSAAIVARHPEAPALQDAVDQATPAAQGAVISQEVQEKAKSDPVAAAQLLSSELDALPPEQRAAAIQSCSQAITDVSKGLSDRSGQPYNPDTETAGNNGLDAGMAALAHVAALAGPEGQKAVADAVAKGLAPGALVQDPSKPNHLLRGLDAAEKGNPTEGLTFAGALRDSLAASGRTEDVGGVDAGLAVNVQHQLEDDKNAYDDAQGKVDDLNETLTSMLSRLGPGLTDEEKQKVVAQFHQDHASEYAAADAAAAKLGATLSVAGPALQDLSVSDPVMGQTLTQEAFDAASELADSPTGAKGALDYVSFLATHPDSMLASSTLVDDNALRDVAGRATVNVYAQDVQATGGDTAKAAQMLDDQLGPLKTAKAFAQDLKDLNEGIQALGRGDLHALEALGDGQMALAMKGAGVVCGIVNAGQGGEDPTEYLQDLVNIGKYGGKGLQLIAKATQSLTGVLPQNAAHVGELAETVGKGLGVLGRALATCADVQTLLEGGNAGDVVQAFGDAAATIGCVFAASPPGAIVLAVGTLVSFIGGAISDAINEDDLKAQEKTLLTEAGLGGVADGLSQASPDALQTLAATGLTPAQVQALAQKHPGVCQSDANAAAFAELAQVAGLSGDDVLGLADALAAGAQGDGAFGLLASSKAQRDYLSDQNGMPTPDMILAALTTENPAANAAAVKYLEDKKPGLVAQATSRALADQSVRSSFPQSGRELVNLLAKEDDPTYRAEVIKASGAALGSLVTNLQTSGSAEDKKQVAQAIGEAARNGTLSVEEANAYLDQLGQPHLVQGASY